MNSKYSLLLTLCAVATSCIIPASGYSKEVKRQKDIFAAYSKHAHAHKTTHRDSGCSDCKNTQIITKEDFCHHDRASRTVVISKPGNYCLAETIRWSPTKRNKTAIVINASNVTLDLSGHELKQVNRQGRCTGILVTTGHDNVKIVNGAVRDFTQLGIVVEGGASNIFLGNDDTVLKVTGCGYGSTYSFYDNIDQEAILQGGIQLGQSKSFEAQGYYTYKGQIDTAVLTNVYAEENGPTGIYFGIGTDISAQNCFFCRNSDTRMTGNPNPLASGGVTPTTTIALGTLYNGSADFGDVDSSSFQFVNCHFDDNQATGDTPSCIGLRANYNIEGLLLRECTFNSNKALGANNSDGFGVFGCILAGHKSVLVEDCNANNNFSEYFTEGFHHSGRNQTFNPNTVTQGLGLVYRNCNAGGNAASGQLGFAGATGFELDFMLGLTVEGCTGMNNSASTSDPLTYLSTQGLFLAGSTGFSAPVNSVSIAGCQFSGNSVNSTNGDCEAIYVFSNFSNFVIEDTVIQNNIGSGSFDIGIWIQAFNSELHNVVVQNCTIESETIGIYSNGDNNSIYQNNTITDVEYGVLLDGSSCNSINNNYVTNALNGFVDLANPSSSLFSNNKVFGAVTPYDVTYTFGPVPVVSGSLMTGFPTGAQVFDNVFMANPTCTAPPLAAAVKAKDDLKAKADKARQVKEKRINTSSKM